MESRVENGNLHGKDQEMAKVEVNFVVHGVSTNPIPFETEHKGMTLKATTDSLEVELTSEDMRHGAMTLRFIGDEVPAAQDLFKPDAKIIVMFVDEANKGTAKESVKETVKA